MTSMFHRYLVNDILPKYQVSQTEIDGLRQLFDEIWTNEMKDIHQYNPRYYYSGSYAKGTMIKSSFDLDIVIYFAKTYTNPTKELVEYVKKLLSKYNPVNYGVALQIKKNGYDVDIVVGKAIDDEFKFATLYNTKDNKEMRASLITHIDLVNEVEQIIQLMKIWRLNHKLNWHKLAMEQTVVRVLQNKTKNNFGECLKEIFLDIKSNIDNVKFFDPANSNNPIFVSDNERKRIKDVATYCNNLLITNNFDRIIR
jgi:hypothetical protein